ncbi:conserved hypothetical protein [Lactobacillus acetotolerans]|jgi:hypothetical protein|uniref:Conjugal transfer protein n=1 Tax=Lactobacillus acetotolerans TaxID=1600 RepID=A0A0D6A5A9_9LACO|nr:conserved hypothetical protein [Lactobacillus acetotolerans]
MKKGKEFIFPENVDKDYGIWKDYTLKDFGYAALAGLVGLIFIAIQLGKSRAKSSMVMRTKLAAVA